MKVEDTLSKKLYVGINKKRIIKNFNKFFFKSILLKMNNMNTIIVTITKLSNKIDLVFDEKDINNIESKKNNKNLKFTLNDSLLYKYLEKKITKGI